MRIILAYVGKDYKFHEIRNQMTFRVDTSNGKGNIPFQRVN